MGLSVEIRQKMIQKYSTPADLEECVRLHRQYGTTYYFASRQLPAAIRSNVDAVYGFVRVPDEWVDNPGDDSSDAVLEKLQNYRRELLAGYEGQIPSHPVLRAFLDVVFELEIPIEEPLRFLDAMESDLTVTRYADYDALREYMRGSAAAVGVILVYVLGAERTQHSFDAAIALGEAMQLANFIRDVGEDARRGRIYLPQTEMAQFGVTESDILEGRITPEFIELMKMSIERARKRFADADSGIENLPKSVRFGVALARVLYEKIMTKVEENGYDVFNRRAKTSPQEKMIAAWKTWSSI